MEEYENSDSRCKREPARSPKQLNICVNCYIVYILTSIGKLRGMVREMLKEELSEIDELVKKILE